MEKTILHNIETNRRCRLCQRESVCWCHTFPFRP